MNENRRILIVGRQQASLDTVTRILESVGCIVTSTFNDGVAIDLVGSSGYDVLLIGDDVPQADGRYVTREARNRKATIVVIRVHNPGSVLTQLRQAGVRI